MKVGVYVQGLENSQPVNLESWIPADNENDVVAIGVIHSSYRASVQVVNQRRRDDCCKGYESEPPGGHSPAGWSWQDDDSNRLWLDLEPVLKGDHMSSIEEADQARISAVAHCQQQDRYRGLQHASDIYLKILDTDPKNASAWYGLAIAQRGLTEYVPSLRALDFCLKLNPNGSIDNKYPGAAWNARGRTLLRCQRPMQALVAFRRALQNDPSSKIFAANLAVLSDALTAKAEASVERVTGTAVLHLAEDSSHISEPHNDHLIGVTSTARRLASENRHARHRHELEVYDKEHTELLQDLNIQEKVPSIVQELSDNLTEIGKEIKFGAEHLTRTISAHLGKRFHHITTVRAGHTRLFLYSKNKALTFRTCTCIGGDGLMPHAGAAAAALRFTNGTTCCFVASDLAASPEVLERCTHSSATTLTILRNRLLCSLFSRLRFVDELRSISEQFDHVFLAGNLGYSSEDILTQEMLAGRVLWGWNLALDQSSTHDEKKPPDLSTTTTTVSAENNHESPPSKSLSQIGRDLSGSLRIVWKSNSLQLLKQSNSCLELVSTRPMSMLGLRQLSLEKKRMPKLVIKNLHCSCLPPDLTESHGGLYLLLGMEPSALLWTSSTHKLRSQVAASANDAYPYEKLSAASWQQEQFALRLRSAEIEDAVLVLSLWAYGQSNSLLGVARLPLLKKSMDFQYTLTLDSRAVALITGNFQLLSPWDIGFQQARRLDLGSSLDIRKYFVYNLAKPHYYDEALFRNDQEQSLVPKAIPSSCSPGHKNIPLDEKEPETKDHEWSHLAASTTALASGGPYWRQTWIHRDLGWSPADRLQETSFKMYSPGPLSWKARFFAMSTSTSSIEDIDQSPRLRLATRRTFFSAQKQQANKNDTSSSLSASSSSSSSQQQQKHDRFKPPPATAQDFSYEEQRLCYYTACHSSPCTL